MSFGEWLSDEYQVERPLGSGGMGVVVLARSRWTGQLFAVKRARPDSPEAKVRLLNELRTWNELPEFPHFVACRFFQTLGDEVAIFAEYVAGGSLADWIAERRLTDLGAILDVAIQLARGLEALHRLGVAHRDIKPANVLLTPEGLVKIADFGLACGGIGYTPAYCSPEQANCAGVSLATDQWSWGVTVLEMFTGSLPCRYGGQFAGEVLESFLAQTGCEPGLPQLPPLLALVLKQCFQRRPAERWNTPADIAEAVALAYQMALGTAYPRPCPAWPKVERTRPTTDGQGDALVWLRRVLSVAGDDPAQAEQFASVRGGSRRARAIADLAPYDEALRRLTQLVRQGRADLTVLLAELCLAKARAHWNADDLPGTDRLAEHATAFLEPHEAEQAALLVQAYLLRGSCARIAGQLGGALELANRALVVAERRNLSVGALRARTALANTFFALEDYPAALAELARARALAEGLVTAGRTDLEPDLAELYVQTARALKDSDEPTAATAWLDRAVPLLERLARHDDDARVCTLLLAGAYRTRARLRSPGDNLAAACQDCEQSLALWRGLLAHGDHSERVVDLAETQALQANLLARLEKPQEALPLYEEARGVYERLVGPLGQHEHIPGLARVCLGQATTTRVSGDPERAAVLSARALELLEPLVAERFDLVADLARAHSVHGMILFAGATHEAARTHLRAAVILYEDLVRTRGRWDLLATLLRTFRQESFVLAETGRTRAALETLDRALLVGAGLAATRETSEILAELLALEMDRAELLAGQGQIDRARAELCAVVVRLENRSGVEDQLARALRLLETLW